MDKEQIVRALDDGIAWAAKWLGDMRDHHESKDTDHLVKSAEKAIRRMRAAKDSLS